MDQEGPDSSTLAGGTTTEHFDMSPRASSKRPAGEDEMDYDSPDKRLRPRSPTVSYRTDADSPSMNSDGANDMTLSGLNETEGNILASVIMGVDITEVFSPERVAQVARRFGLTSGSSMDLTNG